MMMMMITLMEARWILSVWWEEKGSSEMVGEGRESWFKWGGGNDENWGKQSKWPHAMPNSGSTQYHLL